MFTFDAHTVFTESVLTRYVRIFTVLMLSENELSQPIVTYHLGNN
jgi:hypothetical protein